MRCFFLISCFLLNAIAQAQIDSVLMKAIRHNDAAALKKRLLHPIEINATDRFGANALMWATYYCDLPLIKGLVQVGALPPASPMLSASDEVQYYYSLQGVAAGRKSPDVLQYLADSLRLPLETSENINCKSETGDFQPLDHAVMRGRLDVVKFLLRRGVRTDALSCGGEESALFLSLSFERFDAFRLLMQTDACKRRFGKAVDSLLAAVDGLESLAVHKMARSLAIQKFALGLRRIFFGEENAGYAVGLRRVATEFGKNSLIDSVDLYVHRAMALLERIGKKVSLHYVDCLNELVFGCYNTARYDEALLLLKEAMEVLRNVYPPVACSQLNLPLYGDDALSPGTPAVWRTAYTLSFFGAIYHRMGRYVLSLKYYRQSLAITEALYGESLKYSYVANLMAAAYSGVGLYEDALPLYLKSLAIKKELGEDLDFYGGNLMDIAYAYNQMGAYKESLPCFEKAALIMKKWYGEKHQYYAMCMDGEAYVYEHIGEYEKAVVKYKQAFNIYKESFGEDHPYCAFVLNNLATLYRTTQRYKEAQACYRQALAIRKKTITESHPDYAQNLSNLAALYAEKGNCDSALLLYRQAMVLIEKNLNREHPYYAACLAGLGLFYKTVGKTDSATVCYQQALHLNEQVMGTDFPDNADILNCLANLYQSRNDAATASAYFTKASRLQLNQLRSTYSVLSEVEKIRMADKAATAFALLPSFLFNRKEQNGELAKQIYQNELSMKAMALDDQRTILSELRQSGDADLVTLYKQWQLNKAVLGRQALLPLASRMSALDSLQEATNGLEQQLSLRSAKFGRHRREANISVASVAASLKEKEAAVEFIRFRLYQNGWTDSVMYAALVLHGHDSIPQFVPLCEERQLQAVLRLPDNVQPLVALQKIYTDEKSLGPSSLYRLLWQPLQAHLKGVRTVYLAPAGLLHRISFNALRDGSSHLLIARYDLRFVMSTREVASQTLPNYKPKTASVWGNIQYSVHAETSVALRGGLAPLQTKNAGVSSFNFYTADTRNLREDEWWPLPETKKEMSVLKAVFERNGVRIFLRGGTEATEESFKAFDGRSPQVLHLATHGFFLPTSEINLPHNDLNLATVLSVQQNPMFRSGLVLAGGNGAWKGNPTAEGSEDGILTAYEIAQLDLSHTDLVVLSACETALGELRGTEGVMGLQRALKMAGVKQMLVSLWAVPDKETVELMTAFYTNWLNGQTTQQALRNAQLMMKKKYPPFYWAAFVLIE